MPAATEPSALNGGRAGELQRGVNLSALLLLAVFLVARPVANQYYSGESAFAGLAVVLLAGCVGAAMLMRPRSDRIYAPEPLVLAVILWLGLHLLGLLRTPNFGAALSPAADGATYAVMLLCGYFIVRQNPRHFGVIARVLVAMAAVEAFTGVWQYWVDLPRLWRDVAAGTETLPEGLQSAMGLARFHGDNVFGTFINPNSLAAYLLIGIWLAAGLAVDGRADEKTFSARRVLSGLLLVLMLTALGCTDSKGAGLACLAGAWFFAAQRIGARSPQYRRAVAGLTCAAIALAVMLLALGVSGVLGPQPFGRSMQVRFEYWKAALGMIAQHPFAGVGLGGFAEHYTQFKSALGEEVKEVHNDYLQLWVEMGVAALLAYLTMWWLLLRAKISVPAAAANAPIAARTERVELPVVAGGILAFACLYVAFSPFNVVDLVNLLHGEFKAENLRGALQTLALPVIFACAIFGLRLRGADAAAETGAGLQQGAKAAIGAVLVHQLVDFDLHVSAVMCAIFLLGGMLFALNGRPVEPSRPVLLERLSRVFLPLLAVALFPGAVWFGMTSGIPRRAAEDVEREARDAAAQATDPARQQHCRELRDEALSLRRQAAQAAPFDADAWLELAIACESLARTDPVMEDRALKCLRIAERLRPHSFIPKLHLATFYMRRGATGDLEKARLAYAAAAARYPLHPGIRLWIGDALLLQGQFEAAASEYLEAFRLDMRISDSNVRMCNAFSDPRPGVFARHGRDGEILTELTRSLTAAAQEKPEKLLAGMLLRRLLAIAWLVNETLRVREAPPPALLERMRADLVLTAERLVSTLTDLPERAHAAFLLAMAYQMNDPHSQAAKLAWQRARTLQQQSAESGQPGTPPVIFKRLADYYDK